MECLNTLTTRKLYLFFILRPIYGVGLSPSGLTEARGKTSVKRVGLFQMPTIWKVSKKSASTQTFFRCYPKNFQNSSFRHSKYKRKNLLCRSSNPEVFLEKGVLKICSKSTGEKENIHAEVWFQVSCFETLLKSQFAMGVLL